MDISHRIGINGDHDKFFKDRIDALGIRYRTVLLPGQVVGLIYFDIQESDRRWEEIQGLIRVWGASDSVLTRFDRKEILTAEWSRLAPTYEHGYPQPVEDMRWKSATYENMCPSCGAGYVQTAPFRLSGEPNLGKHAFMCLYWTYSVFCTGPVVQSLAASQIRGYEVWAPLLNKSGLPSKEVSQLVFQVASSPTLDDQDKVGPETCGQCGITKYRALLRGYVHIRRNSVPTGLDAFATLEWFGSGGHAAFRETLVSNRLARLILERGWRGVALKPVTLV